MKTGTGSPPWAPLPLDGATAFWLLLLVLGLVVYVLGLDGQYNPSNGDELVYAHIARLTAASGHWLPLVSELDHMRNTKPPLLFWQALLAGDWGQRWSLAALRTPSLIYTLLTAGLISVTLRRVTRSLSQACMGACIYLAFFCTFRYGRTFLTSAPESFWLNLPMFWLLWWRLGPAVPAQRVLTEGARDEVAGVSLGWLTHLGFGLAFGLGLAYKSFALIVPAAATLWSAQLLSGPGLSWRGGLSVSFKVGLSVCLALGVFALWFVLDPNPSGVWQEFVLGENLGKLSDRQGYWQVALFGGGGSLWAQALAYVQNAGLLAFVVLGLGWVGVTRAAQLWRQGRDPLGAAAASSPSVPEGQAKAAAARVILLTWLGIWLLVFMLPSQRSARYLIPAMPALALMLALYWERIARAWFLVSLLLCGLFMGGLGRVAWAQHELGIGSEIELAAALLALCAGLAVLVAGIVHSAWTRACTVAACLLAYACFGLTTAPLNGTGGQYPASVKTKLLAARVAVPNGFNGQFERFQFLLPGNQFVPYAGEARTPTGKSAADLLRLLSQYDAVIWLQADLAEQAPPCVPACTLLASRWEVKGRHQSGEITLANLWYPQSWLFRREWLLVRAAPPARATRP